MSAHTGLDMPRQSTHWDDCYNYHHECAVAKITALKARVAELSQQRAECERQYQEQQQRAERAEAERDRISELHAESQKQIDDLRKEWQAEQHVVEVMQAERDAALALLNPLADIAKVDRDLYYDAIKGERTPYIRLLFPVGDWDGRDACALAIETLLAGGGK